MQKAEKVDYPEVTQPLTIHTDETQIQRTADQSGADRALAEAQEMVVDTPEALTDAGEFIRRVTSAEKQLNETRLSLTRPIDEAKNKVMALFKPAVKKLNEAKMIARRKAGAYQDEERRRREVEARAAAEKARKEQEKLQARAEKALEKGNVSKAEELEARAEQTTAAVPTAVAPKAGGVALRTYYQVEVLDMQKLCAAIAGGFMPPHIVQLQQGEANKFAGATKGAVEIPGCTIHKERR